MSINYKGIKKFDREQLTFIADTILLGALDRVESCLPTSQPSSDFMDVKTGAADFVAGALECAGMALAVLYAQLTDNGLGIDDALHCADHFDDACESLIIDSWADRGEAVYAAIAARKGESFQIEDILPSYPDTRKHAEAFVKSVFEEYLSEAQD